MQEFKTLVIDDNPADLRLIRYRLQKAESPKYHVVEGSSRGDCLRLLAEMRFDCLLLDFYLGSDNGLEILHEVRASGNDVAVVMLTGNGNESLAVELMKAGAQDYMNKENATEAALTRAIANATQKVALQRQLKEKQEELEQFAYVASHDLRSPLCKIAMFSGFLEEECGDTLSGECREYLDIIHRNTQRMERLIESLLEYSKSGRANRELEPVDLNFVVDYARSNLECPIREADACIHVDRLPTIHGHDQALVQLFQNLIGNAVKYRGEAAPIVKVWSAEGDEHCDVFVRDNGIGIPHDCRESIFEPFKRLHAATTYEGSGIGLATCQRIVEQHGGEITVESAPGHGSTFQICFPKMKKTVCPVERPTGEVVESPQTV